MVVTALYIRSGSKLNCRPSQSSSSTRILDPISSPTDLVDSPQRNSSLGFPLNHDLVDRYPMFDGNTQTNNVAISSKYDFDLLNCWLRDDWPNRTKCQDDNKFILFVFYFSYWSKSCEKFRRNLLFFLESYFDENFISTL